MSGWTAALPLWKRGQFAKAKPIPFGSTKTCFADRLQVVEIAMQIRVDEMPIASGNRHFPMRDEASPIFSTVFISA